MVSLGSLNQTYLIRGINQTQSNISINRRRLSTGEQFPTAAFNPASVSFRNTLRTERGDLNAQITNAVRLDGMVDTASSAVNAQVALLQEMRGLAVSAASGTATSSERSSFDQTFQALEADFNRVATTTSFGGRTLLNGRMANQSFRLGRLGSAMVQVDFANTQSNVVGQAATVTGAATTAALSGGDLLINGVDIGASTADGVSTASQDASAIAIANAINSKTAETGVTATVQSTEVNLGTVSNGSFSAGNLSINGVDIGAVTVNAADSDQALQDAINAQSASTGVTASLNASNELILTATDGRNIVTGGTDTDGTAVLGTDPGANTYTGSVVLSSGDTIEISGASPSDAGLTPGTTLVDTASSVATLDVSTQAGAEAAIRQIDVALEQLGQVQAELGASSSSIERAQTSLQAQFDNLTNAEQQAFGVDQAAELAALAANDVLYRTQAALLAQSLEVESSVFDRLVNALSLWAQNERLTR